MSSGWRRLTSASSWQGTLTTASSAAKTARITFTGTRVSILGDRGPKNGAATVLIDGKPVCRAVSHARSAFPATELWTSRTLRGGRHVLTLRTTAVGRSAVFPMDGITVTP